LRNEKEIILPDYWKDLVHMNSISVQLQPIGAHQDIIVKRWDIEKIYLQSKSGIPIDCFYHVYAERKDVNALVVEYEGETYEDRPDREGNDPKYADNVNTRTL
jgi:cephalosporin-C deacetylase-like acetyl esterase